MGRRCACDRLLEAMRSDPRFKVIPVAARYMWLALADAVMHLPTEPGVFMLGYRAGSVADIQMMLTMSEPEVQTCLGILIETQLVTQRDDGVLVVPLLAGSPGRASTSAENGRKSLGKPRKGETREQYEMRRRQREMPLMCNIEGGLAQTQVTQTITQQAPPPEPDPGNLPRARTAAASLSSDLQEESKQQPRDPVIELGNQLAEIAGLDTLRGAFDFRVVAEWLAAGASVELILEVVTMVSSRSGYKPARSLGYFTSAVREKIPTARAGLTPLPRGSISPEAAQFSKDIDAWIAGGQFGPPPVLPKGIAA